MRVLDKNEVSEVSGGGLGLLLGLFGLLKSKSYCAPAPKVCAPAPKVCAPAPKHHRGC